NEIYILKTLVDYTEFDVFSGVQSWYSVTYSDPRVCGIKGASVVLRCRYGYSWIGHYIGGEWCKENKGRFREYNYPNYPDCSLVIDKLSGDHAGVYQFWFYTTLHRSWMTVGSGITLSVTDLQVNAVVGNQNQTKVTCSTCCSLDSHHQYVWYRNGQILQGKTTASIQLSSTRPSEAAYYCQSDMRLTTPLQSVFHKNIAGL
ncbi:hypothetical protein AALO_G00102740, partial [Alosa alosa]